MMQAQTHKLMERLRLEKREGAGGASSSRASSPRHRKITFARLATCILNVERAFKRSSRAREEELLQAAENGDIQRLRSLLYPVRDLNIDCTDQLGRTPLHLAVVNEHKEAVKILLDHVDKRRVYQALLSAINQGNEEIAETIIEHSKYAEISNELKEHGRAYFYLNKFHDENQFMEEITPLMLASQQNRFEVVMALLLKGEVIEKPHKWNCACGECKAMTRKDELRFARSRLNTYRALSSEAYISLSTNDPILTCFELRKELQQVAVEEKYYATEYTSLAGTLSEYVVRLLDKVHGNEELHAILTATTDADDDMPPEDLPRLQLAIKYKEKKFVAHPSCQKKLSSLWGRGFQKVLQSRSNFVHTAAFGCVIILYPLLAAIYIFAPQTKVGRLVRTPVIKFVAQAASYMVFLSLILVHGHVEQGKLCSTRLRDYPAFSKLFRDVIERRNISDYINMVDKTCVRNHHLALIEWLIVLWIAGMAWHAGKQIYTSGVETHFMDIYNAMDFFMLKFYIASLTLRRLTDTKVQTALKHIMSIGPWKSVTPNLTAFQESLYWINADRFYWDAWDPVHMYEALFSVGNIINFARLYHLLAISEHLGPMLISFERMIKDVMKFMVLFILIFLAFMVGMYNLYWYYDPKVRGQTELIDHKIKTKAEVDFGNLEYTFRSVFWAVFGLRDSKSVELGQGYRSRLTESVGYIVFGVYNWGACIILINMVIAMMTRSFDKIATDQETEWKFVRSKLYMEYIKDNSTLPVPLNLIPTYRTISKLLHQTLTWREDKHLPADEEEGSFMGVNGGGRLLANREEVLPSTTLDYNESPSGFHKPKKDQNRRKSSSFGKRLIHSLSVRKFPSLACNEDSDEYKAVIKRVVRRYIFEHLLASVTPNDGMDIEGLKVQTSIIQGDLQAIKPRLDDQLFRIHAEYRDITRNVNRIQKQLEMLTSLCSGTVQPPREVGNRLDSSSSIHTDTDTSEDCGHVDTQSMMTSSQSEERLLVHAEESRAKHFLLKSEETRL